MHAAKYRLGMRVVTNLDVSKRGLKGPLKVFSFLTPWAVHRAMLAVEWYTSACDGTNDRHCPPANARPARSARSAQIVVQHAFLPSYGGRPGIALPTQHRPLSHTWLALG